MGSFKESFDLHFEQVLNLIAGHKKGMLRFLSPILPEKWISIIDTLVDPSTNLYYSFLNAILFLFTMVRRLSLARWYLIGCKIDLNSHNFKVNTFVMILERTVLILASFGWSVSYGRQLTEILRYTLRNVLIF